VKAGFQEGPTLCEEQGLMKVEACMKDGHFSAAFARESTDSFSREGHEWEFHVSRASTFSREEARYAAES
jgi:hypothetical protein